LQPLRCVLFSVVCVCAYGAPAPSSSSSMIPLLRSHPPWLSP
jgi:hypothetical protein